MADEKVEAQQADLTDVEPAGTPKERLAEKADALPKGTKVKTGYSAKGTRLTVSEDLYEKMGLKGSAPKGD